MIDLRLLRDDPDLFRASQTARGEDPGLVDELLAADEARRIAGTRFDALRNEQKGLGKEVAKASAEDKPGLLARAKDLAEEVKAADAQRAEATARADELVLAISNLVHPESPRGGEEDYTVLEERGTIRDFAAEGITVRDHLEIGEALRAIDVERGAKVSGSRFYYLTGIGALLELALINLAMAQATANGLTPIIPPALVKPAAMEGTGFLGQAAENVYRLEADDMYLVGTAEVPARGLPLRRDPPRRHPAAPFRRLLPLLPPRGRDVRQGHPRHLPGPLVRQGRDVHLRLAGGRRGRARAPSGVREAVPRQPGAAVPRDRRRHRRPRLERDPQVRLRGLDPLPGPLPGADVHVELHHVPGAAAARPGARGRRHRPSAGHAQRDPGGHPAHDHRDPREPPAGRRLRPRARRPPAVPRRADRASSPPPDPRA